jgi:nucleoid DNA-binding protein
MFLSMSAISQNDSLSKRQSHFIVANLLDSITTNLKERKATDIVSFFSFGFSKEYGCVVWKEGSNMKGMKLIYKNGKLKSKKLVSAKINKPIFEDYFKDRCDLIKTFKNDKTSYISHDFTIYVKTANEMDELQLFFMYSSYLANKNVQCAFIIKELMRLSE